MTRARNYSPLFVLVAIMAAVAALYLAKEILLPLALAILLSFLLTPLANRLERWGLPRIVAVVGVVGMSFALLAGLGWVVTNQLVDLSLQLPAHKNNLIAKIKSIRPSSETIGKMTEALEEVGKEISGENEQGETKKAPQATQTATESASPASAAPENEPYWWLPLLRPDTPKTGGEAIKVKVVEMPPSPLTQMKGWLGPLVAPLTAAGMVVVMVFFMLLDRENQRNRLIRLFGKSNLHLTTEAFHDVANRVGRYLQMQFLINAGYGIVVALGLWLMGMPSAALWGVLGFLLRFLPYIGPWIAAVMPIMVSVATSDGWTQPLLVVGWYVLLELILNNVAEPLLYGSSIGVSTVGVILAAIFWTWLWGPIGLVLAMPMTVCLVVIARYVPELRFLTVLLADQPSMTPSERVYQRLLAFDYNEPLKVARLHIKTSSLASFYDDVLIPALVLAEQDRHAGLLNEEQEEFVHEAAGDLVEDLGQSAVDSPQGPEAIGAADSSPATPGAATQDNESLTEARILCIPLRDVADETAATMLVQLLKAEGFEVEAEGAESLTSELVDRVAESASDIVVISILPPIAPRDSRLLWKRLRARYPDLPIIVGFWHGETTKDTLLPPEHDAASKVVTTLDEAVTRVRSTAAQLQLAKNDSSRHPRSAAG
jgi:predicted PurR-regulated permease PerM